jgi:short-subunit dehydrogenase
MVEQGKGVVINMSSVASSIIGARDPLKKLHFG